MKDKLVLIDGNSIINRAFYGIPLLANKSGDYTNAIYGFLNILFKILDEENPKYLAIAFDLKGKTIRHEKFADYKGTRKGMPNELASQMPTLKNILAKMNIQIYELSGFEADDILGTLSILGEKHGLTSVIVSGDKDMLQLATETVKIRIPKTKSGKTEIEDYFAKDVFEKYEVSPKEFIEVKGLMGDSSDNVPGVPGIGEKTAIKIIKEFKTIENAIANAENIKPNKAKENIIAFSEQARLSKDLVTIITDVPIDFKLSDVEISDIYNKDAYEEIAILELKSLFKRFENLSNEKVQLSKVNFEVIDNPFSAQSAIDKILDNENVVYSIIKESDKIISISFCYEKNHVLIFLNSLGYDEEMILNDLKIIFEDKIKKVSVNYKDDILLFSKKNIKLSNVIMDLMIGSYILNPSKDNYLYNSLALEFLGEVYPSTEEILGKGKGKINFSSFQNDELLFHISTMSDVYYRCFQVIQDKIKENCQENLLYNIELPLAEVLASMEIQGIKVEKENLEKFGVEIGKLITELESKIYEISGEIFNISSPSQLGKILFEKLGLVGSKKTKTGYSTKAEVLEKLLDKHEIIKYVIDYRTYTKLKSTYVDGLLNVIEPTTSKIFSTFNQTITTTGRISSTEPNLQNIPIRLAYGRMLRKVFVPTNDDYVFLDADYSQIELRILAHMSKDETLIDAFKNNIDIHTLTASEVFKIPIDEVLSYQRSNAKAVNFGIVYGISGFSLSQDLSITKKEAERYIDGYFKKYPKVKTFLDEQIEFAKENGFGMTICGRRRNIPEINSSNFNVRSAAERIAMNMPIQGSAADIIKIAMVKVFNRLESENLQSKLILQVHDELLLEVKKDEIEKVSEILKTEMENAFELLVPLTVDMHQGNSWYELK